MRRRPITTYVKFMRADEPSKDQRQKYLRRYRNGGAKIDEDIIERLGDVDTKWGPVVSSNSGSELVYWVYVGDLWWCRKIGNRYQFGRMNAMENDTKGREPRVVGLWDERRHAADEYPMIVYKDDQKGNIISWNRFEIFVVWEGKYGRSATQPCRFSDLEFEFEEDYKKMRRLFDGQVEKEGEKEQTKD